MVLMNRRLGFPHQATTDSASGNQGRPLRDKWSSLVADRFVSVVTALSKKSDEVSPDNKRFN